jgi:hypothetical protein
MKKNFMTMLKNLGADKLVLLLLAGILLMFSFGDGKKTVETKEVKETAVSEENETGSYERELEKRMEELLCAAYGEGSISVMITLEESENKILATVNEECIFDGDSPYVIKNEAPKIRGVVVILEKQASSGTAYEITQACEVLLGISGNRVKVISKK